MKKIENYSDIKIINLIELKKYTEAKELISKSIIKNYRFYTKESIFNYLLYKINTYQNFFKIGEDLYFIDLFVEVIKNKSFVLNSENIRNCVRLLPQSFKYHNLIIQKIKKEQLIQKLSTNKKTNLLLMLSEYYHNKQNRFNYKKYLSLFTIFEMQLCQTYFIDNFENYFNNCYSSISSTPEVSSKVKKFKTEVLIHKTYFSKGLPLRKPPEQKYVLLGEDIKYINMIIPLWNFYVRQKKVKHGYSCLFEKANKFFIFFSKYIKVHEKCNNNNKIVSFLKLIEGKYNLASVSWDNRYFYEKKFKVIKKTINKSINKSLKFFNLVDLSTIHLQLRTPLLYEYNGLYQNFFNSEIYKNTSVITMNSQGFYDFESTFIHEVTHFMHFQSNNRKCFENYNFLKIKDKIYLNRERNILFQALNQIKNKLFVNKLKLLFDNHLHSSYEIVKTRLENTFKDNSVYKLEKDFILDLILNYKKYKYKDSEQYLLWEEYAKKENISPVYFNQNHEIHARLNEILSKSLPIINNDLAYLTKQSISFNLIRKDLIKFNYDLLENFKN